VSTGAVPDARGWAELARKAEDLGYSSLAIADHLDEQLAPLPALMAAAGATERLRLTPLVLGNDYRHPAILAKELATLDLLSDGRLEIGIGAGWMTSDYDQAGLVLDPPSTRIARLAESIEVLQGLLGDAPVHFDGAHYAIHGLTGYPRPVQRPHPPFLVAGGGRKVLSLAARVADIVGINVNLAAGVIDGRVGPDATEAALEQKLGWIRDAAGDRFEHLELHVRTQVAMVHHAPRAVAEVLAPALGIGVDDALASPHALVGSVDSIVETLQERRERHGISYICWHDDAIDALAPVVARLAGT
jgi:probable F420-dependent oxidoreductase